MGRGRRIDESIIEDALIIDRKFLLVCRRVASRRVAVGGVVVRFCRPCLLACL